MSSGALDAVTSLLVAGHATVEVTVTWADTVSFCPRCVQPVAPDATRCPSCEYDIPPAAPPVPLVPPDHIAEVQPGAVPPHVGGLTVSTESDQTAAIGPVAEERSGLITGLAAARRQRAGPSEQQPQDWWLVGGVAVAAVAVLTMIAVLASSWIGRHRAAVHAPPAITGAPGRTNDTGPSAVASPSTAMSTTTAPRSRSAPGPRPGPRSDSGSARVASRRRGLAQASRIASYLTRSGQARHRIGAAISAISGCRHIASAVTILHIAAEVRIRILTALARTQVNALPDGPAVVADLGRAMRASAEADRHYAAWGQTVSGCHGHAPHNAELAAALQSDVAADAAKRRFADEWDPIAIRYGLATHSANTI